MNQVLRKISVIVLAFVLTVVFTPSVAMQWAFANNDDEGSFEVYVNPQYTNEEDDFQKVNSSQVIPGMELRLCAGADDETEEDDVEPFDFHWTYGEVQWLDLEGYEVEDFATIAEGEMDNSDPVVRFKSWGDVIADHHDDEEALQAALEKGFRVTFNVEATSKKDESRKANGQIEIDINDEYVEVSPVASWYLENLRPDEDWNVHPELQYVKELNDDGDPIREPMENVTWKWVKGSPWDIVKNLDDETKAAINDDYHNEAWNDQNEDWDEEDEGYALRYLWECEGLPVIDGEDPDVSITEGEEAGEYNIRRHTDERIELTLIAQCETWDNGNLVWNNYWINEFRDDENNNEGEDLPWRICFDGDKDYDWAHYYSVDGANATITEEEMNITVQNEDGVEVDPEEYELSYKRTWWEDDQDKSEDVQSPFGIHETDKEGGNTEYVATVTLKDDERVMAEGHFLVVDSNSLNYVASSASFRNSYRQEGWRMHDRFWMWPDDLSDPIVKDFNGNELEKGKDYEVTWYKRSDNADAYPFESVSFESVLVANNDTKVEGTPKEPGNYFVHYEGKGDYYGGNDVLVDACDFDVYASAHYTCMEDGEDDLNSSQVLPGMKLNLCADVSNDKPEDYEFQWTLAWTDHERDSFRAVHEASTFVEFEDDPQQDDVRVRFKTWDEVKAEQNLSQEECEWLDGMLEDGGLTVTLLATATRKGNENLTVTKNFEIDIQNGYNEITPVDEWCLSELRPGESRTIKPEFYTVTKLKENDDPDRVKQDKVEWAWAKGSPWGILDNLEEDIKDEIRDAYRSEDWNENGEDWNEEDEGYALNYLWRNHKDALPILDAEDEDLSIVPGENSGEFQVTRHNNKFNEVTLFGFVANEDGGDLAWKGYVIDERNEDDEEEEYPWTIGLDGDYHTDNDRYTYTVEGKNGTIAIDDLNIVVRNEEWERIEKGFDLSIVWFDEEGEPQKVEGDTIGIAKTEEDQNAGYTRYEVIVTVNTNDDQEIVAKRQFFVADKATLVGPGSNTFFSNALNQDGWAMRDRYWIAEGTLQDGEPMVTDAQQQLLEEGKDYTLTWYERSGTDEDMPDDVLKRDDAKKLNAPPTAPGRYFVVCEGKGSYYGDKEVLVDIVSDEEAGDYLSAYEICIDGKGNDVWARYFVDEGESMDVPVITVKRGDKVLDPDKYELKIWKEVEDYEGVYRRLDPDEMLTHGTDGSQGYRVVATATEGSGLSGEQERWIDVCSTTCLTPDGPDLQMKDAEQYKMQIDKQFIGWQGAYRVPGGVTLSPSVVINNKVLEEGKDYTVRYAEIPDIGLPKEGIEALNLKDGDFSDKFPTEAGNYLCEIRGTGTKGNGYYGGNSILRVQVYQCAHQYAEVAGTAKAATCTAAGKQADQKCSICGDVKTGAVINALGHDYKEVAGSAKAATCTEAGKQADEKCSRCKDVKQGAVIPKAKHKLTRVKAEEATYAKTGNIQYWKCSVCGKLFSDADGTKEIQKKNTVVAKKILKKNTKVTVKKATYKVISGTDKTVTYVKAPVAKTVKIPDTVSIYGVSCKVISLEKGAFDKKKTTSVTIGMNVKTIKGKAFYKVNKLKTLKIKTTKLTKESVKNSLKGSSVKTVKCPASVVNKYKKIFTQANAGKTVKVVAF